MQWSVSVFVCLCVGLFAALCPGGYGYVRETRGDKIEGIHCSTSVSQTVICTTAE